MTTMGRRGFMKTAASAAFGASVGAEIAGSRIAPAGAAPMDGLPMPTRRLGKTGYEVSVCSLGGFRGPIGVDEWEDPDPRSQALAIINHAVDLGVNFINTAPTYGDGASETHFGEALHDRRDEVFISTQTTIKTDEGVEEAFEKSCERLQTGHVDVYFFHGVSSMDDLDAVLDRENGAIRAFERLREKDRVRRIGISGHSSATHIEAMQRYDFDCVFVTMNPAGFRMDDPENLREMLGIAEEKDVGVLGMKALCGRQVGDFLEGEMTVEKALGYALSMPIATAVIGMHTLDHVDENVRAAKQFEPFDEETLRRLEDQARA